MNKRDAQNISDKIVEALKERRIPLGVSQYKIAQETGLSKSSILYVERLKQKPAMYTLLLIADYLEADLPEIIKKAKAN